MTPEPPKNKPVNQVASGAGVPLQTPPPPADNEFLGSPVNNPFRNGGRKQPAPSNPFHNTFEPEG
jgi:hypothetical protein